MSADDIRIDLGALAVVLGNEDGEAAEAVFQDGKALLDVVLAVHAELGRAAAASDDDVLERPRLHEGSRFHDGVRGTRAEPSRIAARGVHQSRDLRGSLREVAAASLVHIAAGLFAAVDHVIHVGSVDPRIFDQMQHGQDLGRLGDQILEHDVRAQVHVHVVGSLDVTDGLIREDQRLRAVFDRALDLRRFVSFLDQGEDVFVHQRMILELRQRLRDELLVQADQVEHVARLHQQDEFVFGHDLAELAEAFGLFDLLVCPRFRDLRQIVDRKISDVGLVGRIRQAVLVGPHVGRKLLQIIGARIDDFFCSLGRAVMHHHAGHVDQDISRSLDHTVAHNTVPFKKYERRTGSFASPAACSCLLTGSVKAGL